MKTHHMLQIGLISYWWWIYITYRACCCTLYHPCLCPLC